LVLRFDGDVSISEAFPPAKYSEKDGRKMRKMEDLELITWEYLSGTRPSRLCVGFRRKSKPTARRIADNTPKIG